MSQYRIAKYDGRWFIETSFDGGIIWASESDDGGFRLKSQAKHEMECLQSEVTSYTAALPDTDYWNGGMPID